jgi:hypothetical protein
MFNIRHIEFLETCYFIALVCYEICAVVTFKHLTLSQNVLFIILCIEYHEVITDGVKVVTVH